MPACACDSSVPAGAILASAPADPGEQSVPARRRGHSARWRSRLSLLALAAMAVGLLAATASAQQIQLQPQVTGLTMPVGMTHAGDGSGRLFVVLRAGRIVVVSGSAVTGTFLNIESLVACCVSEQGLLGLAFHPQYESNGFFYVNYINNSGNTVIARYRVSTNPNLADPASATTILTVAQPAANHNGGHLAFGPDGYLYIGLGDGGGAGDTANNAQNLGTLLGKMLRIDVNGGTPYAIPPDNPFRATPGARPEIWARGFRNPWRYSFDRQTGDLFIGDVGQGSREEVDVEPANDPGGRNYGWRLMEGTACFNPSTGCNNGTLTLPVLEYTHAEGCSITGGYRYRGTAHPALFARYFYGDFCQGKIWGATEQGAGAWTTALLLDSSLSISSFGEDEQGEVYVVHMGTSQASFTDGAVYRITVPAAAPGEIILDNLPAGQQDATRTFTGAWCASSVPGLGSGTLYACSGGGDVYRWRPNFPAAGTYQVYERHGAFSNRTTGARYRIAHAGGSTTVSVNQQLIGTAWRLLGTFSFAAGTAGFVEVSEGPDGGVTSADAVRFVATTSTPPIVVDNLPAGQQDPARTFTGTWCASGVAGLGATLWACGGSGDTYQWRPSIAASGTYRVFEQHGAHPNRSTAVPYRIGHAGGTTTVSVNQQVNGAAWNLLGQFTFSAGTAGYVEVLEGSNGITSADAIRLERVP